MAALTVSVEVSNTGNYDGAEVVQLYIRDLVGKIARPVSELKDFKRIFLKKGESQVVNFTITADKLKFYDNELNYICEPGEFDVMVGSKQPRRSKTVVHPAINDKYNNSNRPQPSQID